MTHKFSYNENSNKTIWIDMDNSPHVPFFAPIIESLGELGYRIAISARNYSQTVQLAELYDLKYVAIGKHQGKNKLLKVIGLFYRAIQLIPFALKHKPVIAISHGSRAQMLAAHFLRIPVVLFIDYEYIQTIPFVKPNILFLPQIISKNGLKNIAKEIIPYPGIKENLYVPSYKPNADIIKELNIDADKIIVTLRPPAHEAHYHNPESETLFDDIIKFLTEIESVQIIILPRDPKQKRSIEEDYKNYMTSKQIIIPVTVFNGLDLIWYSDLVISGGGTMNREAAALGVPVYSIFKGKIGDVDKYLAETNKLVLINNIDEIKSKIKIKKRNKRKPSNNINSITLKTIILSLKDYINSLTSISEKQNIKAHDQKELSVPRKS